MKVMPKWLQKVFRVANPVAGRLSSSLRSVTEWLKVEGQHYPKNVAWC